MGANSFRSEARVVSGSRLLRWMVLMLVAVAPAAQAQSYGGNSSVAGSMVNGICQMISPFVGSNSQFLSLIFLISLGVMVFLWFMNENKEGVMVWLLRTGLALGILINIFTLPQLLHLPSIC